MSSLWCRSPHSSRNNSYSPTDQMVNTEGGIPDEPKTGKVRDYLSLDQR